MLSFAAEPCANTSITQRPWCDTRISFWSRALLLANALTPREQVTQLSTYSFTKNHSGLNPGVTRLGLPEYNYHTEGLHGVRDSCDSPATLWPQVVGMAATGNLSLIQEMGSFMGAGFRAAANANRGKKLPSRGCGLSVYGPTMNIIRDPRWGRNQETVSEDPFLNGAYAAAIVHGVQGDDPTYLQVAFTCKHFTAYSVETDRMKGSNAVVSDRDLAETFLPAFKACVRAGSAQLMCAYNAITSDGGNATGACFRADLINGLLRKQWGWNGSMVSDCDAVKTQAFRCKRPPCTNPRQRHSCWARARAPHPLLLVLTTSRASPATPRAHHQPRSTRHSSCSPPAALHPPLLRPFKRACGIGCD